ncbi:MAG: GNAT family N-acetyltransferase [Leptospiraceae bacterium]|nr:GNAT family N-acetyltransferase [Leptospiraceae bacterium]MDW7976049.1 GNAT family N-acyltransferase [Leptospiraceae bacterium]
MSNLVTKERELIVRLVENQYELEQTLALRYEIFNEELGEGLPESKETKKDRDEYDYFCDHLVVIDKANNNKIVGTYRILRSSIAKQNIGFYSETEFDLTKIYELKDEAAEIGRSCVHKDYRDGSVISLLWSGLAWYVKEYNIRYLMGMGSFHTHDPIEISKAYAYFKAKNHFVEEELRVPILKGRELKGFDPNYQLGDLREGMRAVPPLILGYLRAGAMIGGGPAYDEVFRTTDFFIFFDVKRITERYGQRYLK